MAIGVLAATGLAPAAADAHLVVTGLGPLYDGAAHFALSPEDILPTLALALFAGLRGPRSARRALAALGVAWLMGGVLGVVAPQASRVVMSSLTAALLLGFGGALAADLALPPWACAAGAGALGLVRGAADLGGAGAGPGVWLQVCGMAASAAVLFALAASLTLPIKRLWMIIAARVAGSWVAAAGLLFAGWLIRFGARAS
jgi:hypothetical protein